MTSIASFMLAVKLLLVSSIFFCRAAFAASFEESLSFGKFLYFEPTSLFSTPFSLNLAVLGLFSSVLAFWVVHMLFAFAISRLSWTRSRRVLQFILLASWYFWALAPLLAKELPTLFIGVIATLSYCISRHCGIDSNCTWFDLLPVVIHLVVQPLAFRTCTGMSVVMAHVLALCVAKSTETSWQWFARMKIPYNTALLLLWGFYPSLSVIGTYLICLYYTLMVVFGRVWWQSTYYRQVKRKFPQFAWFRGINTEVSYTYDELDNFCVQPCEENAVDVIDYLMQEIPVTIGDDVCSVNGCTCDKPHCYAQEPTLECCAFGPWCPTMTGSRNACKYLHRLSSGRTTSLGLSSRSFSRGSGHCRVERSVIWTTDRVDYEFVFYVVLLLAFPGDILTKVVLIAAYSLLTVWGGQLIVAPDPSSFEEAVECVQKAGYILKPVGDIKYLERPSHCVYHRMRLLRNCILMLDGILRSTGVGVVATASPVPLISMSPEYGTQFSRVCRQKFSTDTDKRFLRFCQLVTREKDDAKAIDMLLEQMPAIRRYCEDGTALCTGLSRNLKPSELPILPEVAGSRMLLPDPGVEIYHDYGHNVENMMSPPVSENPVSRFLRLVCPGYANSVFSYAPVNTSDASMYGGVMKRRGFDSMAWKLLSDDFLARYYLNMLKRNSSVRLTGYGWKPSSFDDLRNMKVKAKASPGHVPYQTGTYKTSALWATASGFDYLLDWVTCLGIGLPFLTLLTVFPKNENKERKETCEDPYGLFRLEWDGLKIVPFGNWARTITVYPAPNKVVGSLVFDAYASGWKKSVGSRLTYGHTVGCAPNEVGEMLLSFRDRFRQRVGVNAVKYVWGDTKNHDGNVGAIYLCFFFMMMLGDLEGSAGEVEENFAVRTVMREMDDAIFTLIKLPNGQVVRERSMLNSGALYTTMGTTVIKRAALDGQLALCLEQVDPFHLITLVKENSRLFDVYKGEYPLLKGSFDHFAVVRHLTDCVAQGDDGFILMSNMMKDLLSSARCDSKVSLDQRRRAVDDKVTPRLIDSYKRLGWEYRFVFSGYSMVYNKKHGDASFTFLSMYFIEFTISEQYTLLGVYKPLRILGKMLAYPKTRIVYTSGGELNDASQSRMAGIALAAKWLCPLSASVMAVANLTLAQCPKVLSGELSMVVDDKLVEYVLGPEFFYCNRIHPRAEIAAWWLRPLIERVEAQGHRVRLSTLQLCLFDDTDQLLGGCPFDPLELSNLKVPMKIRNTGDGFLVTRATGETEFYEEIGELIESFPRIKDPALEPICGKFTENPFPLVETPKRWVLFSGTHSYGVEHPITSHCAADCAFEQCPRGVPNCWCEHGFLGYICFKEHCKCLSLHLGSVGFCREGNECPCDKPHTATPLDCSHRHRVCTCDDSACTKLHWHVPFSPGSPHCLEMTQLEKDFFAEQMQDWKEEDGGPALKLVPISAFGGRLRITQRSIDGPFDGFFVSQGYAIGPPYVPGWRNLVMGHIARSGLKVYTHFSQLGL